MKILIDYTQIPLQKVGVGVYAQNLLRSVSALNKDLMLYIVVLEDETGLDGLQNSLFKIIRVPKIFRNLFFRFFLEQFGIPLFVFFKKIDVIHSLHYSIPVLIFRAKRICTIHDLSFFLYPDFHQICKRYYFRFFTIFTIRCADILITVSESTKNDLVKILGADPDKLKTVYHGFEHKDVYCESIINDTLQCFNITKPFILFIGTIEPRKNIINLITAFKGLVEKNYNISLVIVGKKGWFYQEVFRCIADNSLRDKVIFTGYLLEEKKFHLLSRAKIFTYPSYYEGFGIPVLEAMSFGVPTVTSNISSLPEITGGAALMVDPSSIDELIGAMERILNDNGLERELREKGPVQARRFSWEKAAAETLLLYKTMH
jgi:glycosyltransferase involved in cell wall biosynthesis